MVHEKEPTSWDIHFVEMAQFISDKSKDPSTKVGVVIVSPDNAILSTGFNGFPRGVNEVDFPERWERPTKYDWIVHAEANAIANAARTGTSLLGSTLYINYRVAPCSGCAGLMIQAGIQRIIGPMDPFPGVGKGSHYDVGNITLDMFNESSQGLEHYVLKYHKK